MIRPTSIFALTLFTCALVVSGPVSAETTVNVNNTTGGNTVCVNGKCTTSEGTSKSHVCVNDQCWDSTNGNVDYQSPDGNTKVKITNETNTTTNTTVNATHDRQNREPTMKQEVKAAQNSLDAKRTEVKKKIDEAAKKFDIIAFIRAELEDIKSFFTSGFLFGKN